MFEMDGEGDVSSYDDSQPTNNAQNIMTTRKHDIKRFIKHISFVLELIIDAL